MHEELFHSPDRPFRATPDCRFYVAHDSIETARQTIVRAVLRAEGPVMVLGGAGLGKSLLGLMVADELSSRFDIVQLHAARLCSRRALLQSILFELQLPYRDMSEGDLRLSILARLEPSSDHAPDGVLIIVDEAHTLPAKLLDELRLITNFTRGNQPRTRLVLIGNLRLEHTFAEPQMESFNQRLAARCYLQPMNRQQTREYVYHQLKVAGFKPQELITDDAVNAVYAASEGVPRLTNQIMDHSLALAVTGNQCPISSALVEEAWADLQQLPAPWHAGAEKMSRNASVGSTSNTVEFGALDDDDEWGAASPLAFEAGDAQAESEPHVSTHISSAQTASCDLDDSDGDSEDDLRLADESQEAAAPSRKSNFFAAFAPSEEGDTSIYADGFDDDSTELDLAPEGMGAKPGLAQIASQESSLRLASPASATESNDMAESGPQSQSHREAGQDELLIRPRVVFDASEAFSVGTNQATGRFSMDHMTTHEEFGELKLAAEDGQSPLDFDSFFHNRPTDEQLLAFADEQQGYDAMGVWENDPPLSEREPQETSLEQSIVHHTQGASQLFGDDFEEEVSLSTMDAQLAPHVRSVQVSASLQKPQAAVHFASQDSQSKPLANVREQATAEERQHELELTARQAAEAADYIGRIQQFADTVAAANRDSSGSVTPTVEDILAGTQSAWDAEAMVKFGGAAAFDTWTLDVATIDVEDEVAIHDEIEDMVSQLNFAAFSVEPFSVEQIAIEPRDQRPQVPYDSSRSGKNDEIYTMHRPLEPFANIQNGADLHSQAADDDRDLLIIEEELPVASRSADDSQRPVTKIAPYSQLFAKLRK